MAAGQDPKTMTIRELRQELAQLGARISIDSARKDSLHLEIISRSKRKKIKDRADDLDQEEKEALFEYLKQFMGS